MMIAPINQPIIVRGYRYPWQRTLYQPAAWIETQLGRTEVIIDELPDYSNPCGYP